MNLDSNAEIGAVSGTLLWLRGLPCLLVLLALLYFFPLTAMSFPGLAVMTVVLSWFLYQYFLPLHLIRRHAMLEHVTSHDSVLRRWLWNGLWSKLLLFIWSVLLALAVLISLSGFSQAQWLLLLASVPLMLLLVPVGLRWAGSESGPRYHFPLALRVSVYLTIAVSTLGLIMLELLGEGVADTRNLSLLQLLAQSWSGAVDASAVREIGWLLGVEAVINDVVWYLMQQASSLSEQSAVLKLVAWCVFLLFVTLQAAVVWFLLAGVLSSLFGGRYRQDRLLQGANPGRIVITSVAALGVLAWFLTQPGVSGFINVVADRSMQALPMPAPDPCVRQLPVELPLVQTRSSQAMSAASSALVQQLQRQLDEGIDQAFELAVPAVDHYLDWNFSLQGQYTQLLFLVRATGAVLAAGADQGRTNTLQQDIEQGFSSFISGKIDETVGAALAPALKQTRTSVQEQFSVGAEQFYFQQALYVEELLGDSACLQLQLPALAMPELAHKSAVGAGPVAGLVMAGIAARGSARIGASVLTRNATKRAVSAGAAKVATKTAQSASGSSIGLSCGPLAPVCVPALFVATWLGADLLLNEIDESINRTALRADVMIALAAEKSRLKAEYRSVLEAGANQLIADISHYRDQRFRILDQGI